MNCSILGFWVDEKEAWEKQCLSWQTQFITAGKEEFLQFLAAADLLLLCRSFAANTAVAGSLLKPLHWSFPSSFFTIKCLGLCFGCSVSFNWLLFCPMKQCHICRFKWLQHGQCNPQGNSRNKYYLNQVTSIGLLVWAVCIQLNISECVCLQLWFIVLLYFYVHCCLLERWPWTMEAFFSHPSPGW